MAENNHWKVRIHVLTYFNHNIILLYKLFHNFQSCLRKLKVIVQTMHRNRSNGIFKKNSKWWVCCSILLPYWLSAYHLFIILFIFIIFHFFTLKITQHSKITYTDPLKMHWFQFNPKRFKWHCLNKTDRQPKFCLHLWIIIQLLIWTSPLLSFLECIRTGPQA